MSTISQIKKSVFDNLKEVINKESLSSNQVRFLEWMQNTAKTNYFNQPEKIKQALLKIN